MRHLLLQFIPCSEDQKNSLKNSIFRYNYELRQSNIEITEIVEINSKKMQCMDILY